MQATARGLRKWARVGRKGADGAKKPAEEATCKRRERRSKHVGVLGRGSSLVGEEREREGGRDAIALAVKFSPGSGETRRGRQEQPSAAEA